MTTSTALAPAADQADTALLNPAFADPSGMLAAIDRLEQTLLQETRSLGALSTEELKELNRRKSLRLLEFTRAARPLAEQAAAPPVLRERLERLRGVIAENQSVLERHLEAVREVAGAIAQAMQERESDGTYASGGRAR